MSMRTRAVPMVVYVDYPKGKKPPTDDMVMDYLYNALGDYGMTHEMTVLVNGIKGLDEAIREGS